MTKYAFLFLVILFGLGVNHAFAIPTPELHVIVLDYSAGTAGNGMTFSVTPINGFIGKIDNTGEIQIAERIAVYNGDVYAANGQKISKLNLDSAGLTDPPFPADNAEDVTGSLFSSLLGIAIDSNGMIYVADDDQKIYPVDLDNIPTSTPSPLTDIEFSNIRHIVIDNHILYVLDVGTDSIFKIDLTQNPPEAIEIYSGSSAMSLEEANSIAVSGDDIYVSGFFNFDDGFDPGVIKINDGTPSVFTRQLSDPTGLAVADGDLYVADQGVNPSSLFRFDLSNPSTRTTVTSDQLDSPSDLGILRVEELSTPAIMEITKSANVGSVLPGDEIIYTLRATNTGPGQATAVIIHDYFPNTPTGQVESVLESGNLFFTSQVNRNGIITNEGSCEREGGDLYTVICDNYGVLDVGDYIEITLKGQVNPLSSGTLVNEAVVDNLGAIDKATISTDVINSVTLAVTKSATPSEAIAGDSVQYTIRVANDASDSPSAGNVIITDDLPAGSASVTIQSEPSPASCTILPNNDNPTQLRCGPYTILFNQSVEIKYTVEVGADAQNPFTNNLSVTCDQCTSEQTAHTTTHIIRESDLSITKEADKSSVIAGDDSVSYTLTVTNDGPSDAANVVVTDNLPEGISFNGTGTSPECSYSEENHRVTCSLPSLKAGTEKTLVINTVVSSSATGHLINTASITSDSMNSDDISEPTEIEVQTEADITILKTAPQNTVAGRTIPYTLSVTNLGPSDAVNVVASDEIPLGLVFVPNSSNPQTDPDCNIDEGTVFCDFGTVVAGETESKSFLVEIPLELTGTIENTADVITDTQETDPDNNTSTVTTIINPPFCGRAESDFANVIYGTEGNDHIKGTNYDDLIIGLGGNDKIHGKKGNDCIIGGNGNDKIWGGDGDDFIEGNAGNDQIHGQKGNDTLIGGDGDDKIYGGQDNDTIDAGTGNDRVHANQGNDTITGGDGNDWIGAGIGDDTVNAGAGNDKIFGRPGNDILNGDAGDDYIHGGQGDDTAKGSDGKDKILGDQGHDTLNGDNGDDTIHGGQGNDDIDGGANTDRCNGAQGSNTIVNCEIEDKKMKEESEENDDDEGEPEDDNDNGNNGNNGKGKNN